MLYVYKPEFKKKIVYLHLENSRTYKIIIQEYSVSKSTISNGLKNLAMNVRKNNADPTVLNDVKLMKENFRLHKELEEM